jgi:hypothetical protein
MIVVDEIATITPTNNAARPGKPKARPIEMPSASISPTSITVATTGATPTPITPRTDSSRPIVNMSRITPSSARVATTPASATNHTEVWGTDQEPSHQIAEHHRQP